MSPSPPPLHRTPFWLVSVGFLVAVAGLLGLIFTGYVLVLGQ